MRRTMLPTAGSSSTASTRNCRTGAEVACTPSSEITALALGGEERLEDSVAHFVAHADARISHRDHDFLAQRVCGKANSAARRERVDRVEDQVRQRLTQANRPPINRSLTLR